MAVTNVDVVVNVRSSLGEGPVWDHRVGRLAWVDILAGSVHVTDPDSGATTSAQVGAPVGALALYLDTEYMLAIGNGFARLSGDEVGDLQEVFTGDGLRMNDGSVDPLGRFLAGSMGDGQHPMGSLYVRDVDGGVRTLLQGVTISNGIAWSRDGTLMYYVDSALQAIDVMDYDIETGTVSGRRRWVDIPESEGTPDGITSDADGCVWVALWDGGAVRQYSPAGQLIREIGLPVSRVTSCAFGGPGLDRLFITSAAVGIEPDTPGFSLAGAVFVADPGTRGVESSVVLQS